MGANTPTSSDLELCLAGNIQPITTIRPHHQNLKKKRTKLIRIHNTKAILRVGVGSEPFSSHLGFITTKKKPDLTAPKITRPCTECGKRFWSWKALFGHMRCHPERPWRGMNPPPNLHYPRPGHNHVMTNEDNYMVACLLMLSNAPISGDHPEGRFACSSCKKVFGSYQALGGHRASHKNVKGCFAITRMNDAESEQGEFVSHFDYSSNQQQHKCSICLNIFPSGQALGGHKRRHWEKEDGVAPTASTSLVSQTHLPFRFDLNLPATAQDHESYELVGCGFGLHL